VRVVLHGRRVGGWVSAVDVDAPEGVTLKPLARVSGWGPPASVFELAEWAAWRWAGPITALLRTASPERIVAALPTPPPGGTTDSGWDPGPLSHTEPVLFRFPPTHDLLPVVTGVFSRLRDQGETGSLLVLTPSAGWAERLCARLVSRGLSATTQWTEARAGWPIVLGARSAAFAPLERLGAVVVLDAHDEAYREERTPTFNAWEVAAERARRDGVPCVLTSPCPSVASVESALVHLPAHSEERAGWPRLSIVDRRGADPRTGSYSEELVTLSRRVLEEWTAHAGQSGPGTGNGVVCVLNRTGRAKLLACAKCNELARCEHCGRAVVQRDEELVCPLCGTSRPVVCAHCGSTRLKNLRPGVARIAEELGALLGHPVLEVAGAQAPTTVTGAPVVVGTEAVLHRVRRAGAVCFLDMDQHLLAPRFSAGEQALALLARACRLVGAEHRDPHVLVQTRVPDHPVLMAAHEADPGLFTDRERALRAELGLPPFCALATLAGPGANDYAEQLRSLSTEVAVNPLDHGRWLVRADTHQALADLLAIVPRSGPRVRVEVDPTDV
jgi:primosomal protein N' (replication factor Y)